MPSPTILLAIALGLSLLANGVLTKLYLGERDDNYLTPQYQGIEDAVERIAKQTLLLFQQFVDMERKIKELEASL